MNFYKVSLLSLLLLVSFSTLRAEEITVAVAANVQFAFEEIKAEFSRDKNIEVKSIFGSSGKLAAQIKNGAPFDVFISADTEFPETLTKESLTSGQPKIYGYGTLVLWTMGDFNLTNDLSVLNNVAIKKISIANPKTAPYGREAVRAMQSSKLDKRVDAKLVYGESISQASQYIVTRAADIGFTAKSIVLSPEMLNKGKWMEVPSSFYSPIAQAAVLLKGKKEGTAKIFYEFLYSNKARTILTKYGYKLP